MRPLALFALVLPALFSASACRSPEQGAPDGAAVEDLARPGDLARPDDGQLPGEFCQGNTAKVDSRAGLVAPATVTSSRVIMNCCDGFILRFHVESVVGVRPSLMVRRLGGNMPAGDIDLGNLPGGIEVGLAADDKAVTAKLAGSIHVDVPAGQNDPVRARACVTVSAPGTALDGARLYTPDVPIMPWGWDERVTFKLLADRTITAAQAIKMPLANLVLAGDPLVRVSSLTFYERAAHRAHWDVWSTTEALRNRVGQVGTQGVPFVVEADGQRIYLGAFYSLISSQSFAGPTIVVENLTADGFTIEPAYPPGPQMPDPRADPRLLKALAESGKLAP